MLEQLLTEQRNPHSSKIDRLSTEEMLRVINAEDARIAAAVAEAIPAVARAVDAAAHALGGGGRLLYIGAGTSGRLGVLDASECPPTFGVPYDLVQGIIAGGEAALSKATEASEDDPSTGERDLLARNCSSRDVVCGIAASGRTPYVLGAVTAAGRIGAKTIGISCTPGSELTAIVDIPIEILVGPEVVAGSTRLKAGTATKLVLNMLSTGVMIRLGYVYGNLMVNVQPKNEKLRDRARRIVREAADIDDQAAARYLDSGGSVPVAIVMAKKNVDRAQAEILLRRSGGVIARALDL